MTRVASTQSPVSSATGDRAGAGSLPRICTKCGFDLRPTPAAARCPECGEESDPDAIVLPIQSTDLRLAGVAATISGAVLLLIGCLMFMLDGARHPIVITVATMGLLGLAAAWWIAGRLHRKAPHRRVIVFDSQGASERSLGTWASVMPYAELDAVDIQLRSRSGRRRLHVRMSLGPIPLSLSRGTVVLSDTDAQAVHDELLRRIAAHRAASAVTSHQE